MPVPKGKCPGDCPTQDEPRAPQPKSMPVPKSTFNVESMWKATVKQGATTGAAALADRRDQASKLKTELE